ncbi:MAG TPA: 16S rRNA (cytidine(1402)-2'-O)-methyltransferase [Casimicrobiaceae bacterium]|nr:16S rRNA (cytidine(1402)-2'-O)-methyltransferase [Casimicrobiaceae bacterium]
MREGTTRWAIDAAEAPFRAEGGSLYVVATPIGNLRDVTLRALDILASADIVAAEDTRVVSTLLARYRIVARTQAFHAHNEARQTEALVAALDAGRSVALVTDAGTPGVSDPGARLVRAARAVGHRIVPIPGASALVAAVSAAGLSATRFAFIGFLPAQAKARRECLAMIARWSIALVLYEAPHRIKATLDELARALDPARMLTIAREMTKAFETIASMPLGEASDWIAQDANRSRGEFVLLVDAPADDDATVTLPSDVDRWLAALLSELPPSHAARVAAAATGVARQTLYARALEISARRAR